MAVIVKPFTFSSGAVIVASEHNSNTDTIYTDYNGNITTANLSASAAIVDTQLAQITTASKVSVLALTVASQAQGDVLYASSATAWARLAPGTSGQFLKTQGAAANPVWGDASFTPTAANALAGSVIQSVITYSRAVQSVTTTAVIDDTIPTTTETGNLTLLDRAITPNHASNRLVIELQLFCTSAGANSIVAGITQDAGTSHIATVSQQMAASDTAEIITIRHEMAAGTTSATTFKVWMGNNSGTQVTMNGIASAGTRLYGGVASSSLRITEIKV